MRRSFTGYSHYGHNKLVVSSLDLITSLYFKEVDNMIVGATLSKETGMVYPLDHIVVEDGNRVYSLRYLRKNKLAEKMCNKDIVSETDNFYILRDL